MDADFWLQRWQNNEIGFHQEQGNPLLRQHWPSLGVPAASRVLVPLCGKTPDMGWLAAQGFAVVGVELSEKAARAFFSEQGIAARAKEQDGFTVLSGAGVDLWVGDFFALPVALLASCSALYDRAAVVALPPALRQRYCEKLGRELPEAARGLLITLSYPPQDMDGPPFAVEEDELETLFSPRFTLERAHQGEALDENPGLRSRGLRRLTERVHRLLPPHKP